MDFSCKHFTRVIFLLNLIEVLPSESLQRFGSKCVHLSKNTLEAVVIQWVMFCAADWKVAILAQLNP